MASKTSSDKQQMRRVLIINYHFPPDGSVGGLRWAGFSKYLSRQGVEVHVVTSAINSESHHPGVQVHPVPRMSTLNDLYNRVSGVVRRPKRASAGTSPAKAPSPSGVAAPRPGLLRRLRSELSAWMVFPDYSRGWLLRAGMVARKIVRDTRPDIVISSGPPHSAHIVGWIATLGRRTPHLIDMRDPWTFMLPDGMNHTLSSSALARKVLPRLEGRLFRRACGIVANAREFSEALTARFPEFDIKWIPNGIDPERLPEETKERFPGLSVAYVGTLYVGRDLGPILEALSVFFARNPQAAQDGSRLRVAGHMTDEHEARFRSQVVASGTGAGVEHLGVVPSKEAMKLLGQSRLAIVLAQNQPLQVPAKIYESVGMRIPTLVITEPDSAAAREAARIGAYVASPEDIQGIADVFEKIWSGAAAERQDPREPIGYPVLAAQLTRHLGRFTGERWVAEAPPGYLGEKVPVAR